MIVSGKEIAEDIQRKFKLEVSGRKVVPVLCVVVVGGDGVTKKFVSQKKKYAEAVDVTLKEVLFKDDVSENDVILKIKECVNKCDGIVVQLPLPATFNTQKVLDAVPETHDVDVLSQNAFNAFKRGDGSPLRENRPPFLLPPVVGVIREILLRNNIFVGNKKVVVVGEGRLVGQPAVIWFKRHEAEVVVVNEYTKDIGVFTKNADIVVSGAGVSGLIKPEMIKNGVVLLDAGTSESKGKVVGDAESACAEKASIFTPVPGGIGPITVAMLFVNLVLLTRPSPKL